MCYLFFSSCTLWMSIRHYAMNLWCKFTLKELQILYSDKHCVISFRSVCKHVNRTSKQTEEGSTRGVIPVKLYWVLGCTRVVRRTANTSPNKGCSFAVRLYLLELIDVCLYWTDGCGASTSDGTTDLVADLPTVLLYVPMRARIVSRFDLVLVVSPIRVKVFLSEAVQANSRMQPGHCFRLSTNTNNGTWTLHSTVNSQHWLLTSTVECYVESCVVRVMEGKRNWIPRKLENSKVCCRYYF